MLTCPYCRNPAMTPWAKLSAGAVSRRRCLSCGRYVSASRTSGVFMMVAMMTLVSISNRFSWGLATNITVVAACAALMLLVVYMLPLVGRDDQAQTREQK